MHSQRDEETWILRYTDQTGRFLDIGAYDGKTFSNIRALAEKGWQGVCVEPSAHAFDLMVADPPPNATLVNALIGDGSLTKFHYCRDAVSSTEDKHARKWAFAAEFTTIWTKSLTIEELLERFPGPYHVINIDTEGTTLKVLDALRPHLQSLATKLLIVEHDRAEVAVEGFELIHKTEENVILCRR